MSQVASFFAISASPKLGANSAAQPADAENSVFAALLAQLQGTQQIAAIAPVAPANDTSTTVSPGQLISAIANSAEHTPASARLHVEASEPGNPEAASPSDLAGQLLAEQQTELAKLIHAALGIQNPEQGPQAPVLTTSQTPATANTVLDANAAIPLQELAGQVPPAETPDAGNPAFAQLIANAAKEAIKQAVPAHGSNGNSTHGKSDIAPTLTETTVTPTATTGASLVDENPGFGEKQNQSGNAQPGHQHASAANGSAKPTDLPIQAANQSSQSSPTFSVELERVQNSPAGAPLLAQVPLDALAVQIARRFEQGISKFEINLHPADLGKLDISINVSDDGRVQAVLRAERADTLDLLRQDSRALENQLRQAGLDVGPNALSFQLSNGNGHRQNFNASQLHRAGTSLEAGDASEAKPVNFIAVRKRDGLDIHV